MKRKRNLILTIFSCVALMANAAWAASESQAATERLNNAASVLKSIASDPDKGIPEQIITRARCMIIVPHMVKAGLVVGAKYGQGVAVCRTNTSKVKSNNPATFSGWSAPDFITIGGATIGAQIGAEDVDLILLLMNDQGMHQLVSSNVEFSLEGSYAAGPVGHLSSLTSDPALNAQVVVYARTKGVFAGQTVEGAKISQDTDATKAVYGEKVSSEKILSGEVKPTASTEPFLQAVRSISHEAATQQARQQSPKDRK